MPRRRAVAFLVLTTLLWAVSFPLIRALSLVQRSRAPQLNTWFVSSAVVTLRFLLGAGLIALFSPRSLRRITRSECVQGVGLGVLCGVGIPWQVDGLSYTDASVSAFLSQGYCVWIPLYVCLKSRKAPSWDLLLATGLVLGGIAVLSGARLGALHVGRGEAETLIASLVCAAQIVWLERPRFEANRSVTITVLMFLVAGAIAAPLALIASGGAEPWRQLAHLPRIAEVMLALTVLCTVGPFLLMNRFQKFVRATEAGLIYCAEPIFASALSLVAPGLLAVWMRADYPNETPSAKLALGGLLITAANVLTQVRKR